MIFRLILLTVTSIITTLIFIYTDFIISGVVFIFLIASQIFFIHSKNRKERKSIITSLESSIEDDRYNLNLAKKSSFYKEVNRSIVSLKEITQNRVCEYESKLSLLRSIIHNIKTGVVLFNKGGRVLEINRAARILLGCGYITTIDENSLLINSEVRDFSKDLTNCLISNQGENLLFDSSTLDFNSEKLRILSIQNIKPLLNKEEMNSWNRLIRSLNHELMNSITPISSLASTAVKLLDSSSNPDLTQALKVIESRSSNLLKFIDSYKTLSQLPEANKTLFKLYEFLVDIVTLLGKTYDISISIICDKSCYLFADPSQMEQVIINLIKNSIEAESTTVTISVEESDSTTILIEDNGRGFNNETRNKALIPFYTTKNSGSGLGLSIVKQVLNLNGGSIDILSRERGSAIRITF